MIKTVFKYGILSGLIIISLLIFLPRKYEVSPFQKRSGTEYWDLTSGSKIGFFHVSAQNEKRPTPAIYLHGGPGGCVSNEHIESLKPLSELGFELFFYDQIGSGHSERLENIEEYTVERHVRDLEEIIQKIGAEKVNLIAQSWGALLATQFLINNSDKVEKAIFAGPGPILPIRNELANIPPPDSLNLKKPKFSNRQGNQKANNWRTKTAARFAFFFGKKLMPDSEADAFFTFLNNELNKSTLCDPTLFKKSGGGGGYYAQIMTVGSFYLIENQRDKLKNVQTPILILRGQCDNQRWGFAAEYLEIFPNCDVEIIPDAGHAIWVEKPVEYLELITEFLN